MKKIRVSIQHLFVIGVIVCISMSLCSNASSSSDVSEISCCDLIAQKSGNFTSAIKTLYMDYDFLKSKYLSFAYADFECDEDRFIIERCLQSVILRFIGEVDYLLKNHRRSIRIQKMGCILYRCLIEAFSCAKDDTIETSMLMLETVYFSFRELIDDPDLESPVFERSIYPIGKFKEALKLLVLIEEEIFQAVTPGYCADCKRPFLI